MKIPDLIGRKYDMLTVLEYAYRTHYRENVWKCKCDCGKICTVNQRTLLDEHHYHSCGCSRVKYLKKGTSDLCQKAGKARAQKRNKDGVNVDMLFREKTISTNTSGVQGVAWNNTARKWHSYIGYQGKRYTLGYFSSFDDVVNVRRMALEHVKRKTFPDYYERVTGKRMENKKDE